MKRLPPLRNIENDQHRQDNTLKETMRILTESLSDFKEEFSNLSNNIHQGYHVEDRFLPIKMNNPTIQKGDELTLRKWVG